MKIKRIVITLLVVGTTAVLATFIATRTPASDISRQNYERIRQGMEASEVEKILGGSERDETNGGFPTVAVVLHSGRNSDIIYDRSTMQWNSLHGWICVSFDEQGQVDRKKFVDGRWLRLGFYTFSGLG